MHVHELLTPVHRYISEPYVGRQLPGAAVSVASRQSSGLSSALSVASDASHHVQVTC